jgi:hypothetical protein
MPVGNLVSGLNQRGRMAPGQDVVIGQTRTNRDFAGALTSGQAPWTSSLSVTHGPGGPPRRMKVGSMSGPLGRPLLRGGGERRVDRISDLRACRWRPGIFNPGIFR